MQTVTIHAPRAHAFNAVDWLARFEEVGGGYLLTPDGSLSLGFLVVHHSHEDQRRARAMIDGLSPADETAIRDHLLHAQQAAGPDSAIVRAWDQFCALHRELETTPPEQQGTDTPVGLQLWRRLDAAEQIIQANTAKTLHGLEIQLWLGLFHTLAEPVETEAVLARDVDALERVDPTLDWNARLFFTAIKSLRAQEA